MVSRSFRGCSPVSVFQPLVETCWFSASWIYQFIQRLGKLQREHSLLSPKTSGKSFSQEIGSRKKWVHELSQTIWHVSCFIGASLEVKLPTIWTDGKAEVWRVQEEKTSEKIRAEKEREERRCRCTKSRKVAIHFVFSMIWGSGGSKSRLAKARVRSHLARWEMKSCTPLRRETHFQVKMYKTHQVRSTLGIWHVKCTPLWRETHLEVLSLFWRSDVEKVHTNELTNWLPT